MATKTLTNAGDNVSVPARASALVAVSGTYAGGPLAFKGSVDGGLTYPVPVYGYPGGQTPGVTTANLAPNQSASWFLDTRGLDHVQALDANGLGGAVVMLVPTAEPFRRLTGYPLQVRDVNPNDARFAGGIPISSRCMWTGPQAAASQWSVAGTAGTYYQKHPLLYDATNIRLVFCGYGNTGQVGHDGEENPNNTSGAEVFTTLTIRAALECRPFNAGATITLPFTFGGQKTGTLDPGAMLVTDPMGVHLRVSDQAFFWTRTFVTTANQYPFGAQPLSADLEGFEATNDKTGYQAVRGTVSAGVFMFGPWLVLGHTSPRNRVVIGIVGDSIIQGSKNNNRDGVASSGGSTNDRGPPQQALGTVYPFINIARDADRADVFANTRLTLGRHAVLGLTTHCIVAYGRNDISTGSGAAAVYANLQAVCQYVRLQGSKAVLCTLIPETTSTDNWATAQNQTPVAWTAQRVALNALIRNAVAAGDADMVVDWAVPYEVNANNVLTRDGGRIISNGVAKHYTWDGIHPSTDGNPLIGTAFVPAAFVL